MKVFDFLSSTMEVEPHMTVSNGALLRVGRSGFTTSTRKRRAVSSGVQRDFGAVTNPTVMNVSNAEIFLDVS